jgi:hypothetical protein
MLVKDLFKTKASTSYVEINGIESNYKNELLALITIIDRVYRITNSSNGRKFN